MNHLKWTRHLSWSDRSRWAVSLPMHTIPQWLSFLWACRLLTRTLPAGLPHVHGERIRLVEAGNGGQNVESSSPLVSAIKSLCHSKRLCTQKGPVPYFGLWQQKRSYSDYHGYTYLLVICEHSVRCHSSLHLSVLLSSYISRITCCDHY